MIFNSVKYIPTQKELTESRTNFSQLFVSVSKSKHNRHITHEIYVTFPLDCNLNKSIKKQCKKYVLCAFFIKHRYDKKQFRKAFCFKQISGKLKNLFEKNYFFFC